MRIRILSFKRALVEGNSRVCPELGGKRAGLELYKRSYYLPQFPFWCVWKAIFQEQSNLKVQIHANYFSRIH